MIFCRKRKNQALPRIPWPSYQGFYGPSIRASIAEWSKAGEANLRLPIGGCWFDYLEFVGLNLRLDLDSRDF